MLGCIQLVGGLGWKVPGGVTQEVPGGIWCPSSRKKPKLLSSMVAGCPREFQRLPGLLKGRLKTGIVSITSLYPVVQSKPQGQPRLKGREADSVF